MRLKGTTHVKKAIAYRYEICLHGSTDKIGVIDIIFGYNDTVKYCGNIGCMIDREFRGHNYAEKACNILFEVARAKGMYHLIITCDPKNIVSKKICEKMGYVYIETLELPPDKKLCLINPGQTQVCRYEKYL